jgi:flagellar hook-length control protein FliK
MPRAADKSTKDQPQAAKIDAAGAQKDKVTTMEDATAARQGPSSADEKSAANAKLTADTTKPVPLIDGAAAQSAPVGVVADANEQAALAAGKETTTASGGASEHSADAPASKKTDAKTTTNQKQTADPNDEIGLRSIKRLEATEAAGGDAKPNAAAVAVAKRGDQPATKQDPSPASDKAAVEQPRQSNAVQANSGQPAPVVAAVTTTVAVEQAAANNGNVDSARKVTKPAGPPNSSSLAAFGRIDRGTSSLTASGPRQAGDGPDTPTVDPARFISRVARAIETAQDRGGPLNLRLSPPELGSMRIQLDVKQGVMTAKVETDTAVARQALLDNLPTLRDRLAEHNVRIDRFDVDVRRDGTGDQANPGKQHQQYQQQYNQTSVPRTASTTPRAGESAPAEPAPLDRIITNTTINLVA